MKTIFTLFILMLTTGVMASETLCKVVESKGEGHWPIPESAFTKERALKATKSLTKLISINGILSDYVAIETDLVFIKGHMLKKYAIDDGMRKEFCEFIKNEAYVRH